MAMSCISLSSCVKVYEEQKFAKLELIRAHFLDKFSFNISDILPLIAKHMIFSHQGGLIPICTGTMRRRWVCTHCKMFIRDD